MYAVNYTALLAENITQAERSWTTVGCLHGWEYGNSDVPYQTISSEVSIMWNIIMTFNEQIENASR